MITVELSVRAWLALAILFFGSGKALQNGGVLYAEGKRWELFTLLGAALYILPVMIILLAAVQQNGANQ